MSRPSRKPRITPDDETSSRFGSFTGLVNTRSRKAIGLKALYVANNVLLSNDKKLLRRPGHTLYFAGAVRGGFTVDNNVYLDDGGVLKRRVSATDIRVVASGFTGRTYNAVTINGAGYFCNGVESGMVRDDVYLPLRIEAPLISSVALLDGGPVPTGFNNIGDKYNLANWRFCATYETADGREGPSSDVVELAAPPLARLFRVACPAGFAKTHIYATEANGTVYRRVATTIATQCTVAPTLAGRVLTTQGTYPLPLGVEQLCFYLGQLYAAEYIAQEDVAVIWISTSYAFHLFDLGSNYILVPGRVTLLGELGFELLIVTTKKVYTLTADGKLTTEADYGSPVGTVGEVDAYGTGYFWTTRGFCTALPFKNLTEKEVSMPPGIRAAFKLVYINGMQQLITITQGGGTPFNRMVERV
jgi:hypothetical protein